MLEEQETRLEYGYSLDDWVSTDYWEKVLLVAVRRTSQAVKNQQAEAEINQTKNQARTVR